MYQDEYCAGELLGEHKSDEIDWAARTTDACLNFQTLVYKLKAYAEVNI